MDIERRGMNNVKILIVDDIDVNLIILAKIIENMGYQPLMAKNVKEALMILQDSTQFPQLILSDISMPEVDGFTFCSILKKDLNTKDIPVIFISAMDTASDLSRSFELGAVDYISKPFDETEVKMRISTHLKLYFMQKDLEENYRHLNTVAAHHMERLHMEQKNTMTVLARLIEKRQNGGNIHDKDRMHNSRILAQGMQLSPMFESEISDDFIDMIESGARLCDVGNFMIPDAVLLKEGPLTDKEEELLKTHTELGAKTLMDIYQGIGGNEFVNMAVDLAWSHHENWDGSGYPRGLKEREIPISARIVRIVNAFGDTIHNGKDGQPVSLDQALSYIQTNAGILFDPDIVNVFIKIYHNFHGISILES